MIKAFKKYKHYCEIEYNGELYNIENEVVFKYRISLGKEFDKNTWNKIINENDYYYFDRISKNKMRKLLTEKELTNFLFENGANPSLIKELIEKYKSFKYIDDEQYAKSYINLRKEKEGPQLIINKLKQKGIEIEVINNYLNNINQTEIIESLIEKELLKPINKNKNQFKNKLKTSLISKGYNSTLVFSLVDEKVSMIKFNDDNLIKNDFEKLTKKYEKKLTGYELKTTIKTKLYQKGYSSDDIKNIID